ncbi:MAG: transporter [Pseudomonadota bacterium]|nr:transporter [Pseudomonadota bacterium]
MGMALAHDGQSVITEPGPQLREEAWWTGPVLASSAATLPAGHLLIEPYLFDVISDGHFDVGGSRTRAPSHRTLGSLTYVNYGVSDTFTVGVIPRTYYSDAAGEARSSGPRGGDVSVQGQYRLTNFSEEHRIPTVSILAMETLPTGKYDELGKRPGDGFGGGAYATTLAVYSQDYFWLPNGRILRARFDLSYSWSALVKLKGVSVYGTPAGFRGVADPGRTAAVDAAAEYSVTRRWVFALDLYFEHDGNTHVMGRQPGSGYEDASGPSEYLAVAPAVEFNWNASMGIIAGARLVPAGRNAPATVMPVVAVNLVF